jgi:hypothetical protein
MLAASSGSSQQVEALLEPLDIVAQPIHLAYEFSRLIATDYHRILGDDVVHRVFEHALGQLAPM